MDDKSKTNEMKQKRQVLRKNLERVGDGQVGLDIYHCLKSRYKILYIVSSEETRVIQLLRMISNSEGYDLFRWDCNRGLCDITTSRDAQGAQVKCASNEVHEFPGSVLDHVLGAAKNDNQKMRNDELIDDGHIFCLLDFHLFLRGDAVAPSLQRQFKEFAEISSVCYLIIIAPVFECPISMQKNITVIDFPFPSYDELKVVLFNVKKDITAKFIVASRTAEEKEEDILKSAAGMTMMEAENAFALTLVKKKTFDIPSIVREKRQIIRKEGLIDFRVPRFSFGQVGGLDALKEWFRQRRLAFSDKAREYGLDVPKGVLLVGVPGTGKSLSCDALADYWQMPLLRLDMGAVFSAHIGESEGNMRKVIKTAEAVAPCIRGDTIITVDGSDTPVEDFFNESSHVYGNRVSIFNEDNEEVQKIVYVTDPHLLVGYDKKELRGLKIKAIIRTKKREKLLKITTKSGQQIVVTKDHLLMDGERKMKKAKEFHEKDRISLVCSNSIQGEKGEEEKQ